MSHQAPPIQWLQVFESAARLLSFKQAAEELCVSPPAVSQQIKVLESHLEIELFDRSQRQLKLTAAGQAYYASAHDIITRHQKAFHDLVRQHKHSLLQISVPLFAAQSVLIPHMNRFSELAGDTELRIVTGSRYVDFDVDDVDAAIRFGTGNWPDLNNQLLINVEPVLVASQRYLDEQGLSRDTFFDQTLVEQCQMLTVDSQFGDWKKVWPSIQPNKRLVLDSFFAVVRSAEQGLGVAIGTRPLIDDYLAKGSLICLNTGPLGEGFAQHGYWLVSPKNSSRKKQIDLLYQWAAEAFAQLIV